MDSKREYKSRVYVVGRRLLALRTQARLTQAELAQILGVSKRSILKWEGGDGYPSEAHLRHLIEVFVARGAFTPGQERDEAEALWAQVSQDAGKRLGLFNAHWFAHLLAQNDERRTTSDALSQAALGTRPLSFSALPASFVDWGEAIEVPILYGREAELAMLEEWVMESRCRVVALLGLGGIGKTSLAIAFATQMVSRFDTVVFRSLRNAPSLAELLNQLIRIVSAQQAIPPDAVHDKIALLVQLLRAHPCLLILDNLETVIEGSGRTAESRAAVTDYSMLIRSIGETAHRSCLLLTSREKPAELGPLEGRAAPVRSLTLSGLTEDACQTILAEKDIFGSASENAALVRLYGGNPLALKLVSEPIREIFGGDVGSFLLMGDAFFNGVGKLLEQQFARSTSLERAVLYWLAIARELLPLNRLVADLRETASQREIFVALESLRRRLLIERGAGEPMFTLQPVILEYLTDRLVHELRGEILGGKPTLLRTHALVQATAKDYLRRSQERLIAAPLLTQVGAAGGGVEDTERRFHDLLGSWRGRTELEQGYGPGNVVNLLRLLRGNLRGLDLSHLSIRHAHLQGVEAHDTLLVGSILAQSALSEAFATILSIALSPDGHYLAAGTTNGEVRVWRLGDRTPILSLQAQTGMVMGVALTADGRVVANSGMDGTVRIWDVASRQLLSTLQGHTGAVYNVALAAEGQIAVSSSVDGTVRLWETSSGTCIAILQGHTGAAYCAAVTADGRLVVSGGIDGTVRLWDTSTLRLGSGQAALNVGTRSEARIISRGQAGIRGLAITPDGRFVAAGSVDGAVQVWETSNGTCLASLHGHTSQVLSVALSADGRIVASSSMNGIVRVWETSNGTCLASLHGHTSQVLSIALSADGRIVVSGSADGTVRLWEVVSGQLLFALQGFASRTLSLTFTADGYILGSGGMDGMVRLWDTASGRLLTTLRGHTGTVRGIAITPDGRLIASCGDDRSVRLWDVVSGRHLTTFHGHTSAVWCVALSANGRVLASCGDGPTVRLWDAANGRLRATLEGHMGTVYCVALTADGQIVASASVDGTVRLWSAEHGECLTILQGHSAAVLSVSLSTDGRVVASGSLDGTARVWDAVNGICLNILEGHTGTVYGVALTPDGRLLASGGDDRTVRLWDVANGQHQTTLQGHTGAVWCVALTTDGQSVASGSMDGTTRVWDSVSGAMQQVLRPDRPYERMDITGLTGITEAQRAALRALGAVERGNEPNIS